MKTAIKKFLLATFGLLVFFSCEKENNDTAPEIPPVETMIIDFGDFAATKSVPFNSETLSKENWLFSAATVGFWTGMIGVTFAVPVASFVTTVGTQPEYKGDKIWEWTNTVTGFTNQYTARLDGILYLDHVKWEMYISELTTGSFSDFLWFEGTSDLDGSSGQWILYYSPQYQNDEVVQIDWKKVSEEVGEVKYTYVRTHDNSGNPDNFNGSYIIYSLQDGQYDAHVNIHVYSEQEQGFTDATIEWNRTDFSGRVKAEYHYNDTDWHNWDSGGNNI